MKTRIHLLLLLVSASACASPAGSTSANGSKARAATLSALSADSGATAATEDRDRSGRASDLSDEQLALWNEPGFQRRFTESYLSETDIEPRVTSQERDMMREVLELVAADELDQALVSVEAARSPTASAVLDFTAGNILFQKDQLGEAAAAYSAAVEKFPHFRRAWQNLGLVHVRTGDFAVAARALTRVLEQGGGNAMTYGLLGIAYSSLENEIAAESAYRMATLLDPDTTDWKMYLARSFFKQGRYPDAVALCDSLIASQPDRADLWQLQGSAYIGLGQPLEAVANFEMVDRLGGATPETLNTLGDIYVNEELFELAVDSYVRGMQLAPGDRPARALVAARALSARGALDETRRLVASIEDLHAERLEADDRKGLLRLRARIAVAEGAGDEEAAVLEEIVQLDPLDGEALILLGQHSGRAGDIEQAIFYYERAESLESFEADAKVRHAQLLVGQGRYPEALPLLRRAQTLNPRENIQQYLEQVERVSQAR